MTAFDRIVLLGGGQQGTQLAIACAAHGKSATIVDLPDALCAVSTRLAETTDQYRSDVPDSDSTSLDGAAERIAITTDLEGALADAELVIESVPEEFETKRALWERVVRIAPEHAVLATNASAFLPSELAPAGPATERFLALHFSQSVWVQNVAEVMPHPECNPAVVERVIDFALDLDMVPIRLQRENRGYVMNALLIPFLNAAGGLLMRGIADPATIDETWRIATSSRFGPFELIDLAGLRTAHAMALASGDDRARLFASYLDERYLSEGKTGVESGEGFHVWPRGASLDLGDEDAPG